MGIDGFSMGNLIQTPEMTPSQIAGEAERLAAKESKYEVKKVDKTDKYSAVKRKEEEEDTKNKSGQKNKNNDQEDNGFAEVLQYQEHHLTEKDFENGKSINFELKLNDITDEIELCTKADENVVETISADKLMNVLKKVNHTSGIFVNKKI